MSNKDNLYQKISNLSDDELLDYLMNFGRHHNLFGCKITDCEKADTCIFRQPPDDLDINNNEEHNDEELCEHLKNTHNYLDMILYHVRMRFFTARLCHGHLTAIHTEAGEFQTITKQGLISYKEQLSTIKESIESILDVLEDIHKGKLNMDSLEQFLDIKDIDNKGRTNKKDE